jgi:hypothetical protein
MLTFRIQDGAMELPMRLSFTAALLFVAAFGFQHSAAAQTQGAQARHQLLDVRFNPVVDLNYMIRKYASSKAELPKNIDGFEEAVGVARQLNTEFGSWLGGGWPAMDAALTKCKNSSEAMQALSQTPETTTSRQGKTIRVRDAAIRYAKALSAVEASYSKSVLPQHENLAAKTREYIAKTFGPNEQKSFAYFRSSLGLADPQSGIPVFLVAESPWPGGFTFWAENRKGTVIISIESNPGSMLLEALMHEAIHALDLETSGTGNVLEEIRTRLKKAGLGENDVAVVQGAHLLVFMQAGETVKRLLDPSHQHYGDVRGVYKYAALQPLADVARPIWVAYLDRKISREEAINKIVEGFLKVAREKAA